MLKQKLRNVRGFKRLSEFLNLLLQEYQYPILFLLVLAGIIGFPVPDEGVLLFAGALVAKGVLLLLPTFMVGLLAAWVGTLFNYWIAFRFGKIKHFKQGEGKRKEEKNWLRASRIIDKYGICAIPICFFIPGIRMAVSYGAGFFSLSFPGFMMFFLCLVG